MPKLSKPYVCAGAALLLLCGSVSAQIPVITSVSPVTAAAGASMTISGSNFNTTPSGNIVYIGGIKASVTGGSGTSLTVTVPKGATNGPVTVTNTASALTAYSRQFFYPSMTVTKAELTAVDLPLNNNILINTRIYGMVAADLSGDGKPDLVVTDNGFTSSLSNTLSIVRNTTSSAGGTITFAAPNNYTINGYNGLSIPAVADFDGDGYLDISAAAILQIPATSTQLQSDLHVYRNTGNGNTGAFPVSGPFTMSLGTNELNAADIDGDGKPDVAGINYSSHTVSLLLNTSSGVGNISFGTETAVNLGTSQLFGRLADIDGDGKPDIISASGASTNIKILRNTSSTGSVSFAPPVTVTTGSNPGRIAVGDIDGDGRLDIVVAHEGSNTLKVFHNASSSGSISFDQTVDLAIGNNQRSVTLGDLNGDGLLDLAIGLDNNVTSVVKNTSISGTISFDLPGKLDLTDPIGFSDGMVIADFNNDGANDLISGVTNNTRLYVYRNSLQFAPTITSVSPVNAAPGTSVAITGTNFNSTPANNYVYFGATRGTVTAGNTTSLTVTVPAGASYGPVSVLNTANHLSATGKQSFIPAFTPGKAGLAATDFVGQTTITSAGTTLYGLLVTDLDNDKKPDIIETDRTGNQLFLRKNNSSSGAISFAAPLTQNLSAYQQPCYPAAGDLNGNGFADIIVPSFATNSFAVLTNGGTISALTVTGSFATGTGPVAAAVGDLDGDGRLDVVTANHTAGSVSILRNTTNGSTVSFAAKTDLGTGADAIMSVRIADMDGDGKPDIIAQNSSTNPASSYLSVFRNTSTLGSVSMAVRQDFTSLNAPWGMVTGDVDGDGLPDIVVANSTSGNTSFSVFRNTSSSGSVSFDTKVDINTVKGQVSVSLGDLNGDGKPDIVVSLIDPLSGSDYKVCAFPNMSTSGNISFGARVDLAAEATPQVNAVQDLDGDGKPDILSGNYDQHTITVYRNASIAPPVTQAGNISVTALATSAVLSWTNGSGSKRAVFMKEDNTGSAAPATGTDYTHNTVLGSGTQIGSTGWYCVYNGTGNTVTVSGLTPSHTYRIMVTEFNDGGLSGTAQYNTSTAAGNPVNLTALATLSSISVTTASTTVNTASVDYAVQFASAVAGLSAGNFSLTPSGITGASVTAVSGSSTSFTVTVNTGTGDGTLALNLASAAGLTPSLTNTLPFAGPAYTIDKTSPALNPVSIASNNVNTARAKAGDIITVSFTAGETIQAPVVTIAGHTAAVSNTAGDQWSATYTMTGADAAGTVSFSIAFSDLAGNSGTTVTGTTNSSSVVFDKTAPVMNAVTIASSNADAAMAKTGDIITLNFTSQETILQPSVQMAGHTITATNTGGNDWSAVYTMSSSDAEGAVTFGIDFNDLSGNAGTTVTATTNGSSVVFDKTAPELTAVTISSSNTDPAKAKPGDVVTLGFTAQEPIALPSVQIAGHTVTATNSSGNSWTATYTLAGTDVEGMVTFSIGFNDLPGNAGTTVTATTNSSSVVFDKTPPVLNTVTIVSSNADATKAKPGDVITVSFPASETLQTPSVSIAGHTANVVNTGSNDWTATYTMTSGDVEGIVSLLISFSDLSGNAGTPVSATTNGSTVSFMRTAPVLTAVTIASDNTNTAIAMPGNTVTLQFTSGSTIGTPTVTIATHTVTATNTGGNHWTASYLLTAADAQGTVPFTIAFNDLAGNAGIMVSGTTDNSSVTFAIPAGNASPIFTAGALQAFEVCENSDARDISALLQASDQDNGQTLTWSVVSAPLHGTLGGLPATVAANGGSVVPSNVYYRPATGYHGTDAWTVRVTDGIASADISLSVTIHALPSGIVTASQTVLCGSNGTTVLTASGGDTYRWFLEGVEVPGTASQLTISQTGNYTAVIVSAQGCSAPAAGAIAVTRLQAPVAQFSFNSYCINQPVQFTNQSTANNSGTVSYQWSDNNGHSSMATSPVFTYGQTGAFDVKLKAIPQACPAIADSAVKTITIVTAVPGIRLPAVDVSKNTLTQLHARTQNGAAYSWVPGNYLTSPFIADPQVFTSAQQEYKIQVTAPGGCITTDTLLVRVQAASAIYVPNVFTPNGDGQNDLLLPTTVATIKALRFFRVFNRWGKMLFETTQKGQGWDGRYNGQLQPLDTYTWVIEGVDESGAIIKKQGTVTLLR